MGMAKSITVIFLAFILLGAMASELKAEKKNTLRAVFLDEAGRPVEGVKAYIEEVQSRKREEKKSDKQGAALFKNLADGIYRVVGRKEGFAPGYRDGLRLAGDVEQKIEIALKPGDPMQKVYFEDPALQQKAYDLMIQGIEALKANRFDEAAQKLKESAEINPSNPDAYFNLAIAQIQTSRWEEAERNLARAIELQPDQQRYQEVKGLIPVLKLNAEGNQALGKRDFKTAIEKFSEMLKLQPNNPEVYYSLALAYTHDNQFDKASELIEKALAGKPNEPEFLNLKKAIEQRREAREANRYKNLFDEGNQLFQNKDYKNALEKFEAAAQLYPQDSAVWFNIAQCKIMLEDAAGAEAALNKAIELKPDEIKYKQNLAAFYLKQGKYDQGMALYEAMFKQAGQPLDDGFYRLGMEFLKSNRATEAEASFKKTLALNPNHAETLYQIGTLKYTIYLKERRAEDLAQAQDFLTRYTKVGKNNENLESARGMLAVISRMRTK